MTLGRPLGHQLGHRVSMARLPRLTFPVVQDAPALEESANLPAPEIIATDIVEDLQAALAQFAEIANDLKR